MSEVGRHHGQYDDAAPDSNKKQSSPVPVIKKSKKSKVAPKREKQNMDQEYIETN